MIFPATSLLSPLRRAALLTSFALVFALPARAQKDCYDGVFCVESEQHGDTVDVFVENLHVAEVTVRFTMEIENLRPSVPLPYAATFPGRRRTRALRLFARDPDAGWSYRFDMQWIFGSLTARHDDAYVYDLPYAPGAAHPVGQGYDGAFSHAGLYAIDWNMPEGTAVLAAREGLVIEVIDTFSEGGVDERLKRKANRIKIRHPDGTIGSYVHLMRGGARVRVGQRVRRGELIGLSGNTGYSTGPHLHFEVYTLGEDLERRTLPVRFRVRGRPEGVTLEAGRSYTH